MDKKCDKYESIFIFGNNEELQKHIEECEHCRKEHEDLKKVSSLIKETKPYYLKKYRNSKKIIKSVAGFFLICIVIFAVQNRFEKRSLLNEINIATNEDYSVIEQMGLPTDDYGLFMVY